MNYKFNTVMKSVIKNVNIILFCGLTICAAGCRKAPDVEKIYTIGKLTWTRSNDGTLTISGADSIPNYWLKPKENLPPWFEFRNEITKIVIGDSVTKIGDFAFFRFENLNSVTIGKSITYIGVRAFCGCSSLKSVIIPNSVKTIANEAFAGCGSMTFATIPNSVNTIGDAAFYQCENLASVIIPNSVISIGKESFLECTSLTSITIGNSVIAIGDYAFHYCYDVQEIINYREIPQIIDEYVFYGINKLTCVVYVPAGSVTDYKADEVWKTFRNIKAIP